MTRKILKLLPIVLALGLLAIPGVASAQEGLTTVEVKSGEVLWVNGNTLVARTADGVREFEVPDEVIFRMDGKELSVHDLKPGMRVAAMIKTVQTPVTLYETNVREATVVETVGTAVVLKMDDGSVKRFTVQDLRDMKIAATRDGKSITAYDLRKGDKLTANVYTPTTATATQREIVAAAQQPKPPAPPAPPPPPPPPAPPKEEPKPAQTLPKTASPLPWVGLAGILVLGGGLGLTVLRRRWGW